MKTNFARRTLEVTRIQSAKGQPARIFAPGRFALVFTLALVLAGICAGSTITTVATGLSGPQALAVAGNGLYFVSVVGGSLSISTVGVGGGAVTTLYNGLVTGNGLAVIGNTLYLIDANSGPITDTQILAAPLAGGGPVVPIYTGSLVGQPIVDGNGITTDGTRLYTADEVQGRVDSLNPDGSALTQLGPNRYGGFFDTEHPNWITNDGGLLYVLDGGRSGVIAPQVVTIPTGGAAAFAPLWVGAPFSTPDAIAAANGLLYIADGSTIWSMPESGGMPTVFFSGGPLVNIGEGGLVFSNNSLFIADTGAGAIFQLSLSTAPEPSTISCLTIGISLIGFAIRKRNSNQRAEK